MAVPLSVACSISGVRTGFLYEAMPLSLQTRLRNPVSLLLASHLQTLLAAPAHRTHAPQTLANESLILVNESSTLVSESLILVNESLILVNEFLILVSQSLILVIECQTLVVDSPILVSES